MEIPGESAERLADDQAHPPLRQIPSFSGRLISGRRRILIRMERASCGFASNSVHDTDGRLNGSSTGFRSSADVVLSRFQVNMYRLVRIPDVRTDVAPRDYTVGAPPARRGDPSGVRHFRLLFPQVMSYSCGFSARPAVLSFRLHYLLFHRGCARLSSASI